MTRRILLLLAAPAALLAQPAAGVRAAGMAGAYTALSRGPEALADNPANLALPGGPVWSLHLPQLAASGTVVGLGLADLRTLADFSTLGAEAKAGLLARVPASGTAGAADVRLPLVAWQRHAFAVGATFRATGEHTLGRDLVDLGLNGYDESRTDYQVGNTGGRTAQWLDVAAGYARRLPVPGHVTLGVAAHYYHGRAIARSRMFEPSFDVETRDVRVEYVAVQADGGRGWGVDLGLAAQPHRRVTLGLAVTDAASRMRWSEALSYRTLTLDKADFDSVDAPALYREFDAARRPLDPAGVPLGVHRAARGLYDGAYFPATLRAGAAWTPFGRTDVSAAYRRRLSPGALGDRWAQAASVGVQQGLPLVTLRAGVSGDLRGASLASAGLSLGPLDASVGRLRDGTVDGARRDGLVGSFGMRISAGRR